MIDLPKGLNGVFRRKDLVRQLDLSDVRVLLRDGRLVRYSCDVLIDCRYLFDLPARAAALLHGCSAADDGTIHVLSGYERKARLRPSLALHQGLGDSRGVSRGWGRR